MAEIQRNYADGFSGDESFLHPESGVIIESEAFADGDKDEHVPCINGSTLLRGPSLDSDASPIDLSTATSIAIGRSVGGFRKVDVRHGKNTETVYVAAE